MWLRYAGVCQTCGTELPARAEAVYERTTKSVRCLTHDRGDLEDLPQAPASPTADREWLDPGVPGSIGTT